MPAKIILWDVMDTLVHDPFRDTMPQFFGLTLQELLRDKHPTAWARFERNELSEAEFLANFWKDGRSYDTAGFTAAVRAAYRLIDGIEPLLARLSDRHPMHALSNYPVWYRWIEERLQLSRYLQWSFVSCHTALRKPDPAAYQHAASTLNAAPSECVFVDDRPNNCEAARGVGMHAVHFDGDVGKLHRQLQAVL